jgi:hypothetical protein
LPPTAGPLVRWFDPAGLTRFVGTPRPAFRSLLAPPASDRAESPAGSPVDEPPERLADA